MKQRIKLYGPSYKRLDKEKESGSESGEETELLLRDEPSKIEMPTIEKEVEDGDTLQSLAVRYHCRISDLKRLNTIHNDNEIFAKRTIKVPHRPFTTLLASVHISGQSSPDKNSEPSTSQLIDIDSVTVKLTGNLLAVPNGKTDEVNNIIFNSHIQKPYDKVTEDFLEDDSENARLLSPHERASVETAVQDVSRLNCNGADADISWITLIVCIVILIFAFPLIYVLYIAEHLDKYHHHGS